VSRSGSLHFTPITTVIQKLRRRGAASAIIRKKRQLLKLGRAACAAAGGGGDAPSSVAQVAAAEVGGLYHLVTPVTQLLSRAGGAVNTSVSARSTLLDLLAELGDLLSCATIGISNGSITVDFGDGCALNGVTIAGEVALGVSTSDGKLTVSAETDALSANGVSISGTIEVVLDNNEDSGSFTLDLNVTYAGTTSAIALTGSFVVAGDAVTFNANGTFSTSGITGHLTLVDLHKPTDGGCYPDGGTMVLDPDNTPEITVTFSAETPTTREVTVQVGSLTPTTTTLPECG